jgi:hypothetical protein
MSRPTLHLQDRPAPTRTVEFRDCRPRPPRPPRERRWSHQDDLTAAIGKKVSAFTTGNLIVDGRLLAADQFTVKIDYVDPTDEISGQTVFFKHAIVGFRILEG